MGRNVYIFPDSGYYLAQYGSTGQLDPATKTRTWSKLGTIQETWTAALALSL